MQAFFIFAVIFFGIYGAATFTGMIYNSIVDYIIKRKGRKRGNKRN